ncbi:MAG TPA: ABC transporter ATP-binding protein [bacterium]|nr:ABC transporter ATP-binding protein [bacterium]
MASLMKVINVSKIYDLGSEVITALNNVNIEIYKGEFISIIGKSGSGKSTLMHILGLLDTPTSGEIILNGQNTKGMKEKELAKIRNKEIGFVFQSFNLLQRTTTLDNVMLPLKYSDIPSYMWRKKGLDMLKMMGLENRLHNKSNELSGGQKQRVAIARALINDPSIILADEPTGNLDSKTGDEIIELFSDLHKQGRTVVIVTHNEEIADLAQRKIIIKDGEVIEQ